MADNEVNVQQILNQVDVSQTLNQVVVTPNSIVTYNTFVTGIPSVNGISGAVNIVGGTAIAISSAGNSITVEVTGTLGDPALRVEVGNVTGYIESQISAITGRQNNQDILIQSISGSYTPLVTTAATSAQLYAIIAASSGSAAVTGSYVIDVNGISGHPIIIGSDNINVNVIGAGPNIEVDLKTDITVNSLTTEHIHGSDSGSGAQTIFIDPIYAPNIAYSSDIATLSGRDNNQALQITLISSNNLNQDILIQQISGNYTPLTTSAAISSNLLSVIAALSGQGSSTTTASISAIVVNNGGVISGPISAGRLTFALTSNNMRIQQQTPQQILISLSASPQYTDVKTNLIQPPIISGGLSLAGRIVQISGDAYVAGSQTINTNLTVNQNEIVTGTLNVSNTLTTGSVTNNGPVIMNQGFQASNATFGPPNVPNGPFAGVIVGTLDIRRLGANPEPGSYLLVDNISGHYGGTILVRSPLVLATPISSNVVSTANISAYGNINCQQLVTVAGISAFNSIPVALITDVANASANALAQADNYSDARDNNQDILIAAISGQVVNDNAAIAYLASITGSLTPLSTSQTISANLYAIIAASSGQGSSSTGVSSVNSITGAVVLVPGRNISISGNGHNIGISVTDTITTSGQINITAPYTGDISQGGLFVNSIKAYSDPAIKVWSPLYSWAGGINLYSGMNLNTGTFEVLNGTVQVFDSGSTLVMNNLLTTVSAGNFLTVSGGNQICLGGYSPANIVTVAAISAGLDTRITTGVSRDNNQDILIASISGQVLTNTSTIAILQTVSGGGSQAVYNHGVVNYQIDGSGTLPALGRLHYIRVPYSGYIQGWSIIGDVSGSAAVDIWKGNYSQIPFSSANSICSTDCPTLSGTMVNKNDAVSVWTTPVSANDFMLFNLNSVSGLSKIDIALTIQKVN